MFIGKYSKLLPYWNYFRKDLTYREYFDLKFKNYVKKESKNILNSKEFIFLKSEFNYQNLLLHLNLHLNEKLYVKIADDYILKKKKISLKYRIFNEIKNFFYIKKKIQVVFFVIKSLLSSFLLILKKKNNEQTSEYKYDIIKQFFFGNADQKLDFCDEEKIKKNYKILTLLDFKISKFSTNQIKEIKKQKTTLSLKKNSFLKKQNIFQLNKIKKKNLKIIFRLLIIFFKKPFITSIFLNFIIKYEVYSQIFERYKNSMFIHAQTLEMNIAAIREACDQKNVLLVNYSRSFLSSKYNDVLTQPDELVFIWGDIMKNFYDKKINNIKYIITSLPYFHFVKKKKTKISNKKFITIFDNTCDIDSTLDPANYFSTYNYIFNFIKKNKNFNLIIKLKYKYLERSFNNKFKKQLDELLKQNKIIIKSDNYSNNYQYYKKSKIVVGISSLSTSLECLYFNAESICLVNNAYKSRFLNKINKIYPFAYKNFSDFKKVFESKVFKKKSITDQEKLKKYFFNNTFKTNSYLFIKSYLDNYNPKVSKKKLVKKIINNN